MFFKPIFFILLINVFHTFILKSNLTLKPINYDKKIT